MVKSNDIHTIAFLGTGLMGSAMVRRLARAGFAMRVWNRTRAKLDDLVAAGCIAAASPADAVRGSDVTCLCLTDADAMEQTLFGPGGVAEASAGAAGLSRVLIDFSTIGPVATRRFSQALTARCRTSWIDAPVSGGVPGAEAGSLIVFCGGEEADIARAEPLFAAIARRATRLGPLGAGQTAKLCNQLIVATNFLAITEAIALAKASGLDAVQLVDALAGGFADSAPLRIFGPRMATGQTQPKLGEIALMRKDIELVVSLTRDSESDLPLASAAAALYRRASESGLDHEDLAALVGLYPPRVD